MVSTTTENTEIVKHHYQCTCCGCPYVIEHDEETLYIDNCPACGSEKNDPYEIT